MAQQRHDGADMDVSLARWSVRLVHRCAHRRFIGEGAGTRAAVSLRRGGRALAANVAALMAARPISTRAQQVYGVIFRVRAPDGRHGGKLTLFRTA